MKVLETTDEDVSQIIMSKNEMTGLSVRDEGLFFSAEVGSKNPLVGNARCRMAFQGEDRARGRMRCCAYPTID